MDEGKEKKNKISKNDIMIILTLLIIGICVILGYIFFVKRSSTELKLLGDENVVLEVGDEYKEAGFVATTSNKNVNDKVEVISDLNTDILGNYNISYNLKIGYLDVSNR